VSCRNLHTKRVKTLGQECSTNIYFKSGSMRGLHVPQESYFVHIHPSKAPRHPRSMKCPSKRKTEQSAICLPYTHPIPRKTPQFPIVIHLKIHSVIVAHSIIPTKNIATSRLHGPAVRLAEAARPAWLARRSLLSHRR
jgi:hypothetical protein